MFGERARLLEIPCLLLVQYYVILVSNRLKTVLFSVVFGGLCMLSSKLHSFFQSDLFGNHPYSSFKISLIIAIKLPFTQNSIYSTKQLLNQANK